MVRRRGHTEPARALSTDLLTGRADCDRYDQRIDTRFKRHPAIIQTLCQGTRGLRPSMWLDSEAYG